MSIQEFLGHKASGGGGAFLERWKEDGSIDVFLHPKAGVTALWSHSWYKIVEYTDKESKKVETRLHRWNCWETETVLREQKYRDKEDRRKLPPAVCPFCLTLEYVRDLINDNQLSWTEPLFRFEVPRAAPLIIHAGGFCDMFKPPRNEKFSDEDMDALKTAGISLKDAFKENAFAKLEYLFRVVSVKDPNAGAAITFETQSLGDKLKKVIEQRVADLGPDEGHPLVTPYAFHWSYDKNETFSDKYDVAPRTRIPVTPEIQAAFEQDPPDVSNLIADGDLAWLRASFEEHCTLQLPWDELFAAALAEQGDEQDEPLPPKLETRTPEVRGAAPAAAPEPPVEEDVFACDACGGAMLASETVCKACGAEYGPDGKIIENKPEPPPEPKPAPRTRSQAAAAAATPPATKPAPAAVQGAPAAAPTFRTPSRRRGG